jgi:hypothetical protein
MAAKIADWRRDVWRPTHSGARAGPGADLPLGMTYQEVSNASHITVVFDVTEKDCATYASDCKQATFLSFSPLIEFTVCRWLV